MKVCGSSLLWWKSFSLDRFLFVNNFCNTVTPIYLKVMQIYKKQVIPCVCRSIYSCYCEYATILFEKLFSSIGKWFQIEKYLHF